MFEEYKSQATPQIGQQGSDDQQRNRKLEYQPLKDFLNPQNCALSRLSWPSASTSKVGRLRLTDQPNHLNLHLAIPSPIVTLEVEFSPFDTAKEDIYKKSLEVVEAVRKKDYESSVAVVMMFDNKSGKITAKKNVQQTIIQQVAYNIRHGSKVRIVFTLEGLLYEEGDVSR